MPPPTGGSTADDNYLELTQSFWALGSFTTGKRVALHNFLAGLATLRASEVTLVQNVKDNFFTVLDAQEKLGLAQSNLDFAQKIYDIAKKGYEVGEFPKLDELAALVQLNLAKQTVVQAEGTDLQARAALNPCGSSVAPIVPFCGPWWPIPG